MVRGLVRVKRARAGFFEEAADLPDVPDPQAMREAARKNRQDADELEQLLEEEE